MPTQPRHLDFPNSQVLLIGEDGRVEAALEPQKADKNDPAKDDPEEELRKLADEDAERMEALGDDDAAAIFADLQARAEELPKLQTTF